MERKRSGIRDVAQEAGVSITTVSRALNGYSDVSDETRERIRDIALKLNYAPNINARALGGMTEPVIGLLMSDIQEEDISNMVFGIISGVYRACADNGCDFVLLATDVIKQTRENFIQFCRKKNLDAIVIMGLRMDDIYIKEVKKGLIPCALIDIGLSGKNLCNISIDNLNASYEAVSHLISNGHGHIGMINGEKVAEVAKERYSGYAKALLENGIILNPQYVCYSDFKESKAYQDTSQLLQENPEITALFCASDQMALGAIEAIKDMDKKIPEDISVVGFDDIPIAKYVEGGLTTIKQEPYKMGYLAGEAVYNMMNQGKVPFHIEAPYELIVRNTSTGIR